MKKYLSLWSVSALLALNSCVQEDLMKTGGEEVAAQISLSLPGNAVQTRVDADNPALTDMRLFIYVYNSNNELVTTIKEEGEDLSNGYNGTVRLVTGQDYKIAAWADFGGTYYSIDDFGTVKLTDMDLSTARVSRQGNDLKNDAYFVCEDVNLTASATVNLTLKRPFGLVQVTTKDWGENAVKPLRPTVYQTTMKVPTSLNLLTGVASEVQNVDFTGVITDGNGTEQKLSFDYILAGETNSRLADFNMHYYQGANKICDYAFTNIPVQRNYITNITGNVLTKEGSLNVTIDQNWDGTQEVGEAVTVTNVAGLREALRDAKDGDMILLAEGKYDLGGPEDADAPGPNGYYMIINKGISLIGQGNVEITTSDDANSGVGSLQNLVTVNAAKVTIENINFVANYNTVYTGPNKIIEVRAADFTARNCTFTPNSKAPENGGCAVYFSQQADNGLVEGCEINNAAISFDGLMKGNFEVKGNTFDEGNANLAFTTPNWTSNDVTASTLYVNIEGNTFKNFEAYEEGTVNPAVRAYYGILNLKNNTFPTDGVYWKAYQFGSIFVDYNSIVDQYWHRDRTEPKSFAISNNVIEFETETEPDNNWYAWHGRKASVDMTAKSSWEVTSTLTLTGENRPVNKSIWLNIDIDWPIVLFKQDETGNRFWKYWNSEDEGGWVDVPADKNVPTDAGDYEIKIAFNNGVITEYINNIEIASYEVSEKTTAVKEVIFNSYSFGESYKTTWTYPVVK